MDSVQAVDGDCQSAAGAEKVGVFVKESVGDRGENECFGWEKQKVQRGKKSKFVVASKDCYQNRKAPW